MRVPVVIQMQSGENGAAALCMILGGYKRFVPLEEMREKCVSSRNGSSPEQIIRAAASYGLDGRVEELSVEDFPKQGFPILVHWKRKYYAVVRSVRGDAISITDPARGEYRMTLAKFRTLYSGKAILFTKTDAFSTGGKRESLFELIKDRLYSLRRTFIALSVFTLICTGLNLGMARVSKALLDSHLGKAHSMDIHDRGIQLLLVYLIFLAIYTLFSILKTRLSDKASRKASAVSGSRLFKNMFRQPMKFFEQYSAGELLSRIDGNTKLDNSIVRALVPRVIDVVMTVVYIVYLFSYQPVIASVCLFLVILHIILMLFIQEKNAIASKSTMTSTGIVSTSLLNGMNMIETIKSTGSERDFYNLWYEAQSQFNENKLKGMQLNAFSASVSVLHKHLLEGIQLFLGAIFIMNGKFTLGTLSLFQSVLNYLISSMGNCISTVDSLQQMRNNIERVDDINRRPVKQAVPLPKSEYGSADKLSGQISAKHICYRYNKGDELAVNDVSIEASSGQVIAIVGATGCGKSTLLKILSDLYEPESGQVLYSGKLREEIPDVVFHSSVMTVDQETMMFEDSVYNNIRMWDPTIENYEVMIAARDAQIHQRITRERKAYGAFVRENGRNFSGGELQRLELARALSHEPTILFLDEFTSALDALTEDRVIRAIKDKGTTCVIVAHRLSTIVDCDRIYVMDHGRIVQEGTHSELYAQEGLYKQLIGSQ